MSPHPSVLVVLDEPFYKYDDQYYCCLNWWRFGSSMAEHFSRFGLWAPLTQQQPPSDANRVDVTNLEIFSRFFFKRIEQYYRNILPQKSGLIRQAKNLFAKYDIIVLRTPSPSAKMLARIAWQMNKPTCVFVAGNILTQNSYAAGSGPKALIAKILSKRLRAQELEVARHSAFVGVWGNELLDVFRGVNEQTAVAAAPSMSKEYIYKRADTCTDNTVRLVRVARVLPSKGIDYLIQAVAQLQSRGYKVALDVAGNADEPGYKNQLIELASRKNVQDSVTFHGQLEFGPRLFDLYKNADIHVVSSLGEGLPRCIVEGRSFGLPTVATNVGGIPTVIENEKDGLLVSPSDAQSIADAIDRIISDSQLRQQIIANGYGKAEKETREFQAKRISTLMKKAIAYEPIGSGADDIHQF